MMEVQAQAVPGKAVENQEATRRTPEKGRKLYVSHVPSSWSALQLKFIFGQFGVITDFKIFCHKVGPGTFAFITYRDLADASRALVQLHKNYRYNGLTVRFANNQPADEFQLQQKRMYPQQTAVTLFSDQRSTLAQSQAVLAQNEKGIAYSSAQQDMTNTSVNSIEVTRYNAYYQYQTMMASSQAQYNANFTGLHGTMGTTVGTTEYSQPSFPVFVPSSHPYSHLLPAYQNTLTQPQSRWMQMPPYMPPQPLTSYQHQNQPSLLGPAPYPHPYTTIMQQSFSDVNRSQTFMFSGRNFNYVKQPISQPMISNELHALDKNVKQDFSNCYQSPTLQMEQQATAQYRPHVVSQPK